jgi:hypothetical protein
MSWWLAVEPGANTPNWDLASTATIDGREGLVLIEAKAHVNEIKVDGKGVGGNAENHARIERAFLQANAGLCSIGGDWNLCADRSYQLCNRFAWAWKVASLGYPVILVYLGFLGANEMSDQGVPFASHEAWEALVRSHGRGLVPENAWDGPLIAGHTWLRAVIRSVDVGLRDSNAV